MLLKNNFIMETLKYTVIKTKNQYIEYCNKLEELLCSAEPQLVYSDEIELIELLIDKWDLENNSFTELDPIQFLKSLMIQNKIRAKDLTVILGLSKGTISKILNSQKGLSKETIRKLSDYFKVSHEAFNRPYKLSSNDSKKIKK